MKRTTITLHRPTYRRNRSNDLVVDGYEDIEAQAYRVAPPIGVARTLRSQEYSEGRQTLVSRLDVALVPTVEPQETDEATVHGKRYRVIALYAVEHPRKPGLSHYHVELERSSDEEVTDE